jgi:phage terminase large subunit-like protein
MVSAIMTPWRGGALTAEQIPKHEPSKRLLTWSNGSTASTYSADEPDSLRGPQHDFCLCDELAAWQYASATWHEGVKMGLRGSGRVPNIRPRAIVTTTPRPTPIIRELLRSSGTVITRGSTFDNAANLPAGYIADMMERYEGTRIGRQELHAEVLDDVEGALWNHGMIETARVCHCPQLVRVVVALDPSGSGKKTADEVGMVIAGIAEDRHVYVLEDLSGRYSPMDMAKKAIAAYRAHSASRVVAEVNFGGQMIEDLIRSVDQTVSYRPVTATRGKIVRAEPVAALYEQGKVHHVGMFAGLEDELCSFSPMVESRRPGQLVASKSPGRLDALVWAITDLALGESPSSLGARAFKGPSFTFGAPDVIDSWDVDD